MTLHIAAAAYRPQWHDDWASLEARLKDWITDAAARGAQLLVFPEYAGIEAALIGAPRDRTPPEWVAACADVQQRFVDLNQRLATAQGVHILAGSLPWAEGDRRTNAAAFCAPGCVPQLQHKVILTPYEREEMALVPGQDLTLFDTALGRIGVLICYDSEFPQLARALAEAGADMILVPSNTDLPAGQTRVRQSCRARAIEQQCLLVQAPLIGVVPDCEVLDIQTGRVGFYGPPDHGLPANGIIAQGDTDAEGWVIAEVDPSAICAPRRAGQVGNFGHWAEQADIVARPVKSVTLA